MSVRFTKSIRPDLPDEFRRRIARAMTEAAEATLEAQKEVAPVAFADGMTEMGWARSYQAGAKRSGDMQGGTMKRSITLALDKLAFVAVFRCQVPYAFWVHEGTTKMIGRPFLTRPIKEVGIPALGAALRREFAKPFNSR
jgi:hypothetical protein